MQMSLSCPKCSQHSAAFFVLGDDAIASTEYVLACRHCRAKALKVSTYAVCEYVESGMDEGFAHVE